MTVAEVILEESSMTAPEAEKGPPGPPVMPSSHRALDIAIAERAYALWLASGRAPGLELDFWLLAENELFGSGDGPTA